MSENNITNPARIIKFLKHSFAILIVGYPIAIVIVIWIRVPNSLSIMLSPAPHTQPLGWIIFFILLLSIVINYYTLIIICNLLIGLLNNKSSKIMIAGKAIVIMILIIGSYILKTITVLCAVMAPATLSLIQTPFGRMFFGTK